MTTDVKLGMVVGLGVVVAVAVTYYPRNAPRPGASVPTATAGPAAQLQPAAAPPATARLNGR